MRSLDALALACVALQASHSHTCTLHPLKLHTHTHITRAQDSVAACRLQRPSIEISRSFQRGLAAMQKTVDRKVRLILWPKGCGVVWWTFLSLFSPSFASLRPT